jgi:hypothetical protein
VLLTDQTTFSRAAKGTRADLKPGEAVYVFAQNNNGKLTAVRLQVGKDGLKPTQ